jgi:uncharacterized protein YbjT (DUF2867 family)
MTIFLAGASGFIGERVLDDLVQCGHTLTAHVHSDSAKRLIQAKDPGLQVVQADLSVQDQVLNIIPEGTETLIYLPGVLRESKELTFEGVHVRGVQNLLDEARRLGVHRWIQMSALGVTPNSKTKYYETKWRAEQLVHSSGLDWTIVRPSLVFDDRPRRQHSFVSEIVKAIRTAPVVPILGTGKYLLQPASVDDVSQTIVQSLTRPETVGKTYELGGPVTMSYSELIAIIAHAMGTRKPFVQIPVPLIMLAARMLGWLPSFPVTVEQIQMLIAGNYIRDVQKEREWRDTFELPLKPFNEETCRASLSEEA